MTAPPTSTAAARGAFLVEADPGSLAVVGDLSRLSVDERPELRRPFLVGAFAEHACGTRR
jgi:hypothetical protein